MSSPPWAGSICRGLSQCQQLVLVLGENLVRGQAAFFGWMWLVSCRAMAVPAALSRALCWAECKGPESLPLVGVFILMATTVGRRTLIIHLCTLNFNRGKQTVLQISSPGFEPLLYLAGNMGRCWRTRFCSNLSTPKLHKCSICCARLLNMSIFNSSNVP